jgi:hypothetical protein
VTKDGLRTLARWLGVLPHIRSAVRLGRRAKRAFRFHKPGSTVLWTWRSSIDHGVPTRRSFVSATSSRDEDDSYSEERIQKAGFAYQVDYSRHPAYIEHLRWNVREGAAAEEAVDVLNTQLLDLETMLSLKRVELRPAVEKVNENVGVLIERLVAANDASGLDFRTFTKPLHREIMRVIVDDLAYFDRRNSYTPIINNATELALRNELAIRGYLEFDLSPVELEMLRQRLRSYADGLEERYRRGSRSRDELSTSQIDPETTAVMDEMLERRGLGKAVSDVRHERARAGGFALEISPDDAHWWHSAYEDVGLVQPNRMSYYHTDESRDVYKAIIYLSDVNDDSGPFCLLPQSFDTRRPRFEWVIARANLSTLDSPEVRTTMHDLVPGRSVFTSRIARGFFGMLPARLRGNSHFGFDVPDDSGLAALMQAQEVRVTAPAGRVIAFDGSRIIHRGGLVRRGRRTALQLCFDVDKQNGRNLYHALKPVFEQSCHVE